MRSRPTKMHAQSSVKRGGAHLTMGLLDLGNVISRTGFRSHVLHSLEGKAPQLCQPSAFSKKAHLLVC